MTAHAKLSASGAHRWMACPGSVRVESSFENTSSSFADEGTAAHFIASLCLELGKVAQHYLGCVVRVPTDQSVETHFVHVTEQIGIEISAPIECEGRDFEVDQGMAGAVQTYVDYCDAQAGQHYVERRVDFSRWVPGGFGTADFISVDDGVCTVADLKYGQGIPVYAKENPQAMLYALGVLDEFEFLHDIEQFKIVIVQPRVGHTDEWLVSREDLLAFGESISSAAEAAFADDAPLNPTTDGCRFCKARGSCRALAEQNFALASDGFEAVETADDLTNPELLSSEELGALLGKIDILSGWADAVKAHASGLLRNGKTVPGFKLVAGKSNRKWVDEELAGKALARKLTAKVAYVKKTITITEAEKHLGKDNPLIKKHTTKPEGKPTLAPESSPKPALHFDPSEGFEAIDEAA